MKPTKRDKIRVRLETKPHLHLVERSVYDIPERVEEYDPDMFVVFNSNRQTYELHSLQYPGDTFQLTFPFSELDVRALRHIWRNDISVHGKDIFRRIEREEEEFKKRRQREEKNWMRAVASETQSMFAKDAWL